MKLLVVLWASPKPEDSILWDSLQTLSTSASLSLSIYAHDKGLWHLSEARALAFVRALPGPLWACGTDWEAFGRPALLAAAKLSGAHQLASLRRTHDQCLHHF